MTIDCWVNGEPGSSVSALDRGLHYGDGLFETLAVEQGGIRLLDYHLQRLTEGCERLGLVPPPLDIIKAELMQAASVQEHVVLKLVLTRGVGERGYRPSPHAGTTRILMRHPWPDYPMQWGEQGIHVRICNTRMGHNRQLAGLKHLNRLEQVLARAESTDAEGFPEGLMLDEAGSIIEGTMTNVFVRLAHGALITPSLEFAGVTGVMRRYILERARQAGFPVRIRRLSLAELMQAAEIFVCNSIIGVWPVIAVGEQRFSIGNMTRRIQAWVTER